jgi:hypothetical protein
LTEQELVTHVLEIEDETDMDVPLVLGIEKGKKCLVLDWDKTLLIAYLQNIYLLVIDCGDFSAQRPIFQVRL